MQGESRSEFTEHVSLSKISQLKVEVTVYGPIDSECVKGFEEAIFSISRKVRSLANSSPALDSSLHLDGPSGEAQDPSEITADLPGVDLTDRRRGPRKKA